MSEMITNSQCMCSIKEMEPMQNDIQTITQHNLEYNAREFHTHDIGKPPTNPADRRRLVLLDPPHDKYVFIPSYIFLIHIIFLLLIMYIVYLREFSDLFVAKVIGHNCMDGWLTPAILWKDTPQEFRDRAWEDFTV